MQGEIKDERVIEALMKQEPMEPQMNELGGDIYYQCHWLSCGATVHRWQNYCDQCGQRIAWEYE